MKRKSYLVTSEGLEKIKVEIETRLKKKEELANVLNKTMEAGDLSENDGYTLALEDIKNNDAELFRLNDLLTNSKVVKNGVKGKVEIGDSVVVKDQKGVERTLTIVGENEGNPLENKISHKSPLGLGILGKAQGDTFDIKTPKEVIKYKIEKILD